jgi:hypothetical protein
MLLLLMVPVLALVTCGHRYLQLYAPSNAVIARARTSAPRPRRALILAVLASTTLVAMHLLAAAVAAGAPGWLNLVVLVLAWDTIKFGLVAASEAVRCSMWICWPRRRGGFERGSLDHSLSAG